MDMPRVKKWKRTMVHADDRLNYIREWFNVRVGKGRDFINKSQLAEFLAVRSKTQLYDFLNGKSAPNSKEFLRWIMHMGWEVHSPEMVEEMKSVDIGVKGLYPVPKVYARLCAGGGSFETSDKVESLFAFRTHWLESVGDKNSMVLMEIMGDSMSPCLEDGDMVMIDESQKDIHNGKIYAVGMGEEVLAKRAERVPGKVIFKSDNPAYSPMETPWPASEHLNVNDHLRIIGRVVWTAREL